MDAEDQDDAGKVQAKQAEAADDDVSSADVERGTNVVPGGPGGSPGVVPGGPGGSPGVVPGGPGESPGVVPGGPGGSPGVMPGGPGIVPECPPGVVPGSVVPVSLIPVVAGHVGDTVLPLISGNGLELSSSLATSFGSGRNNIISDTPSAVNLVDKDGKILPTLPAISSAPTAAGDGGKVVTRAVKYVDQTGRVIACVECSLPGSDPSPVVRVVDSDGRVITDTAAVDKNGRVISGVSTSSGSAGISETNATGQFDAGNFQTSLSAISVGHGSVGGNSIEECTPNSEYRYN